MSVQILKENDSVSFFLKKIDTQNYVICDLRSAIFRKSRQ